MKRKRDILEEIEILFDAIQDRKLFLLNIQENLIQLQFQYQSEIIQKVEILPFFMISMFELCICYNEYHYRQYSLQL